MKIFDNRKLSQNYAGASVNAGQSDKREKRFTVIGVEFVYLFLLGIITAGFGWIVENVFLLITKGFFDCRFHLLPFIFPYVLIPFAFHIFLGDPDDLTVFGRRVFKKRSVWNIILSNLVCFVAICVAVFLGELFVGYLWDALFGVTLWNYSDVPLHVTKYTSVLSVLGFGGGAYLLFRSYRPLLKAMRSKIGFSIAKYICCFLGTLMILDSIIMLSQTIALGHAPMYWRVHLR